MGKGVGRPEDLSSNSCAESDAQAVRPAVKLDLSVDLGRPYLEDIHDIDRKRATIDGFDASDTRHRLE